MTDIAERLHSLARITRRTIGSVPLAEHAAEMAEQLKAMFGMDACVIPTLGGGQSGSAGVVGLTREEQA